MPVMGSVRTVGVFVFLAWIVGSALPCHAQSTTPSDPPPAHRAGRGPADADRLFLGFAEEAAIVGTQWWEGQFEFRDGGPVDATILRVIAALRPMNDVEIGGRVGFGDTSSPAGVPEGSGATDLDLWAKYHLAGGPQTDFAVGGLVTIPTGDDSVGLGYDAFAVEVFGSVRQRLTRAIVSGHAGLRINGDGHVFGGQNFGRRGADLTGKTSVLLSGGVVIPISDELAGIGEVWAETERFRQTDSDVRILGGLNWRPFRRGLLRGGVSVGLTDGAPDAQVLVGYAFNF